MHSGLRFRLRERRGALHSPGAEGSLQGAGGGALQRGDRLGPGASPRGEALFPPPGCGAGVLCV